MSELVKIRIGNDIVVSPVLTASEGGAAIAWTSDVKRVIAFSDEQRRGVDIPFSVTNGTLSATFCASAQKFLGKYHIIVVLDDGNVATWDAPAFELVKTTADADTDTGLVAVEVAGELVVSTGGSGGSGAGVWGSITGTLADQSDLSQALAGKASASAFATHIANAMIHHTHANKATLDDVTAQKVTGWDDAASKKHSHTNKSVLDGITADDVAKLVALLPIVEAGIVNDIYEFEDRNFTEGIYKYRESGTNTYILVLFNYNNRHFQIRIDNDEDRAVIKWRFAIDYDEQSWTSWFQPSSYEALQGVARIANEAIAVAHSHANKSVLDSITAAKVASWDGKPERLDQIALYEDDVVNEHQWQDAQGALEDVLTIAESKAGKATEPLVVTNVTTNPSHTYAQILAAYNANRPIFLFRGTLVFRLVEVKANELLFGAIDETASYAVGLSTDNVWSYQRAYTFQMTANRITGNNWTSANDKYPSTAACDARFKQLTSVATTNPAAMLPNVFYNLGTLTGAVTFALADGTAADEYMFEFSTGDVAPTITWMSGVKWLGGFAPTINANKTYQISIVNGCAVCGEF